MDEVKMTKDEAYAVVNFTEEELEIAKKCFCTDSWDCVHYCPYNDGRCNDFTVKYGSLPSAVYARGGLWKLSN